MNLDDSRCQRSDCAISVCGVSTLPFASVSDGGVFAYFTVTRRRDRWRPFDRKARSLGNDQVLMT